MKQKKLKVVAIYDNGGKTFDRYTIVVNVRRRNKEGVWLYDCIGSSETGAGFFTWSECIRGKHLGNLVPLSALSPELQQRINHELKL